MTESEHLAELLDQKNLEIGRLQEQVEKLTHEIDGTPGSWCRHVRLAGEQTLPVPRLEIVHQKDGPDWSSRLAVYRLVYRHLLGDVIGVPLGLTKISGGGGREPRDLNGEIDLPFRDGAHIAYDARTLGLPAFVVLGDDAQPVPPRASDPNQSVTPDPGRRR